MEIQIQHLLKLNYIKAIKNFVHGWIQIQHLLKLNCMVCLIFQQKNVHSNTTLVKVK